MCSGEDFMIGELRHRVLLKLRFHWRKLKWSDRLSAVLALMFVIIVSVDFIMRAFQKHSIARTVVGIAAICFLLAALLLYIVFGSRGPKRIPWWAALFVLSWVLLGLTGAYIPLSHPYFNFIGEAWGLSWGIVYVILIIRFSIQDMREDVGTWASRIAHLFVLIFSLAFPTIIIFLVTNGDTAAFIFFSPRSSGWMIVLEGFVLSLGPSCLFMLPALAHSKLPWSSTSETTKDVIVRLLAIVAALSGGLFALLLHFDKGALAQANLGPLTVGILFAIALLIPFYRSVITTCWQRGVLHLVDIARLRAAVRDAMNDWWAAVQPSSKHGAESRKPEAGALERVHPDDGVAASCMGAPTCSHRSDRHGHCAEEGHSPEWREVSSESREPSSRS